MDVVLRDPQLKKLFFAYQVIEGVEFMAVINGKIVESPLRWVAPRAKLWVPATGCALGLIQLMAVSTPADGCVHWTAEMAVGTVSGKNPAAASALCTWLWNISHKGSSLKTLAIQAQSFSGM